MRVNAYLVKKVFKLLLNDPKYLIFRLIEYYKKIKVRYLYLNHQDIKLENNLNNKINYIPTLIIPVYNGYDFVVKLFSQLLSHSHIKYNIIIIEDCSTDRQIREFINTLPQNTHNIHIILNDVNLGFVKSVNKGMHLARGHFIILNTDIEVPKDFAIKILQPIIDNSSIASVTPFTNSGTICSFPNFCKDNELIAKLDVATIDASFSIISAIHHNTTIPTGVGFCMAINKDVFTKIGSFDEKTFGLGYGEENDWCMRASGIGYKNIIATNCFVYHKHGASFNSSLKQKLLEENSRKLQKKHPQYEKLVHEFFIKDSLKNLRNFIVLKLLTDNFYTNVILNSVSNGGSKIYVTNLINEIIIKDEVVILIESTNFLANVNLTLYHRADKFYFEVDTIFELLAKLKVNHLIVNHLIFEAKLNSLILDIISYKNTNFVKLNVLIHDYFFICPSVSLLNYDNRFCNIPENQECAKCLQNFNSKSISYDYVNYYKQVKNITSWRKKSQLLLKSADEIVVPSQYVKSILNKTFANLDNVHVIKHNLKFLNTINFSLEYTLFEQKQITIAVLGNIHMHKGSKIIIQMAKLSKEYNFKWLIFGKIFDTQKLLLKNLMEYGNYNHNNLPQLINQFKIDLFVFPSIWPEAFSYVVSEMMLFNLPIVAFNLGAQAEKLANYAHGYLVDKVDSKDMLAKILSVIQYYTK